MSTNTLLSVEPVELPLLPLRDVVVFPHMVIPLFVGRPKSIKALEVAMEAGNGILLVAQKSAVKDEPEAEDLFQITDEHDRPLDAAAQDTLRAELRARLDPETPTTGAPR